jgi:hypothetical protein
MYIAGPVGKCDKCNLPTTAGGCKCNAKCDCVSGTELSRFMVHAVSLAKAEPYYLSQYVLSLRDDTYVCTAVCHAHTARTLTAAVFALLAAVQTSPPCIRRHSRLLREGREQCKQTRLCLPSNKRGVCSCMCLLQGLQVASATSVTFLHLLVAASVMPIVTVYHVCMHDAIRFKRSAMLRLYSTAVNEHSCAAGMHTTVAAELLSDHSLFTLCCKGRKTFAMIAC